MKKRLVLIFLRFCSGIWNRCVRSLSPRPLYCSRVHLTAMYSSTPLQHTHTPANSGAWYDTEQICWLQHLHLASSCSEPSRRLVSASNRARVARSWRDYRLRQLVQTIWLRNVTAPVDHLAQRLSSFPGASAWVDGTSSFRHPKTSWEKYRRSKHSLETSGTVRICLHSADSGSFIYLVCPEQYSESLSVGLAYALWVLPHC